MRSDFYSERTVRGRRQYRCQFCALAIAKASHHVCVSSCSTGKVHTHRAHLACHETATGQKAPPPAGVPEVAEAWQ